MIEINIYKTAQVAKIIGVHPNTVRLYEELLLIPKPQRAENGYRIFTDLHIAVFRLARTAFQIEVMQNGLRKKIVNAVRTAASGRFDEAMELTEEYLQQVRAEIQYAEDAITIAGELLAGQNGAAAPALRRQQVSAHLQISMDQLRNWEMNGLLSVKRKENGYRVYSQEDIQRLKMIRVLRCANYSLEAILRMLNGLDQNPQTDLKKLLNTPREKDEIIAVCDQLIASLLAAEKNAQCMLLQLQQIKNKYD